MSDFSPIYWKTTEVALVESLYPTHSAREIAAVLGCKPDRIRAKALELGLSKRPGWTDEEDRVMRRDYLALGTKAVSAQLRRSCKAIRARAQTLGIARMKVRPLEGARRRWPQAVVDRARVLHERGFGYASVAEALSHEFVPSPSWNTVRDWCAGRTRS